MVTRRPAVAFVLITMFVLPRSAMTADWWNYKDTQGTPVQKLASSIDRLQRHIDKYGTVVPKDPDVWGQSRLMTHRIEFETEMKKKLTGFSFRLNAAEFTRDSAFLSSALSLQAALSGEQVGNIPAPAGSSTSQQTIIANVPTGTDLNADDGKLVPRTDFSDGFSRIQGRDGADMAINIEPTIELDQLKRYLDHLNEIRRLNEGDDTADSPGYALHLIRVPVSVLPGKSTRKGYGAEITMTIRPHLGHDLLPNTFRGFVINGVKDRITPRVLSIADRGPIPEIRALLAVEYGWSQGGEASTTESGSTEVAPPAGPAAQDFVNPESLNSYQDSTKAVTQQIMDNALRRLDIARTYVSGESSEPQTSSESQTKYPLELALMQLMQGLDEDDFGDGRASEYFVGAAGLARQGELSMPPSQAVMVDGVTLFRVAVDAYDALVPSYVPGDLRKAKAPIPGERGLHYSNVEAFLHEELNASYTLLEQASARHLWEIYCTPELVEAIRSVRRGLPKTRQAKLKGSTERVLKLRADFFTDLGDVFPEAKDSTTANLAWHIIVEAALLDEQLKRDMKRLSSAKNACLMPTEGLNFAGPNPQPEARAAFNEYVNNRWPIHVFALDPITQDQNVASGLSRRREMQMLLALSAAQRSLSLQSLNQFVRRLEYDLETIDLNRTAVAFAHGNDTFGWRFYPRVQVPPIKSNLSAAVHDLIIGGPDRDDDLEQRQLEPHMRECTAIVVMPSFVPSVVLDTRSNWFRLTDHHGWVPPRFLNRKGDLRNAVDLSAEIVELRQLANACSADAAKYRQNEVHRLRRAVDTLDRSLPLQTTYVEMPFENTLGGTQLFASSTMGLKPVLRDWYGAPGVVVSDRSDYVQKLERRATEASDLYKSLKEQQTRLVLDGKAVPAELNTRIEAVKKIAEEAVSEFNASRGLSKYSTTLFLVGRNFSVLDTRVIAGGVAIPDEDVQLISRDVIQITVPSTVSTVANQNGRQFVEVHIATPYGPTPRLQIPVANDAPSALAEASKLAADAKKHAEAAEKHAKDAKAHAGSMNTEFKWAKTEFDLLAKYHDLSITQVHPLGHQRAILSNESIVPFPDPAPLQFGYFLKVKYAGKTLEYVMNGTDKAPFIFDAPQSMRFPNGKVHYDLTNELLPSLMNALGPHRGKVEELVVEGFIRMIEIDQAGHLDGLPVVKLPELKIKVSEIPNAKQNVALANRSADRVRNATFSFGDGSFRQPQKIRPIRQTTGGPQMPAP